jgi:hypothetical protein
MDPIPGDMEKIDTDAERLIIRKAHHFALQQLEQCISDVLKGYDQELNTMGEK